MAEDAGAADVIAGGRLQLGISRGFAGAGDRRVALLRLRARTGRKRCRHGTPPCGEVPRRAQRGRVRENPIRSRCSPTHPGSFASSRIRKGCAIASGGAPPRRDIAVGGEARHEPPELHAQGGRERRAACMSSSGGKSRRTATRGRQRATGASRARRSRAVSSRSSTTATAPTLAATRAIAIMSRTSTTCAPSSAARTRPSRTGSSRSSPRTTRLPRRTRCS